MNFKDFMEQQQLAERVKAREVALARPKPPPKEPVFDVVEAVEPTSEALKAAARRPDGVGREVRPERVEQARQAVSRLLDDQDGLTRRTAGGRSLMVVPEPADKAFVARTRAFVEEARRESRLLLHDPDGEGGIEPVVEPSAIPFLEERVKDPVLEELADSLSEGIVIRVSGPVADHTARLWEAMGVTTVIDPDAPPLAELCRHE